MKIKIIVNGSIHNMKDTTVIPNIGDYVKIGSDTHKVIERTIVYSMSGKINEVIISC